MITAELVEVFELVEYYGLKKAKQLIKKNYIIMVSFILSILIVLFSSQLIVEVDVIHSIGLFLNENDVYLKDCLKITLLKIGEIKTKEDYFSQEK